jgi:hypothetical protein
MPPALPALPSGAVNSSAIMGLPPPPPPTSAAITPFFGNNTGSSCYGWLGYAGYSAGGNCGSSFSSDARLKTEIAPVENGLETILKLKPVSYLWKTDTKNHVLITAKDGKEKAKNYGFIAQDVEKVLPELVSRMSSAHTPQANGPDGKPLALNDEQKNEPKEGYMMLDYNGLIAPTVKAVQELYARWSADHDALAALKAANDHEAKEIEELKADNDNMRHDFEVYKKAHP